MRDIQLGTLLAFGTGLVNQEFLLQNEYLPLTSCLEACQCRN